MARACVYLRGITDTTKIDFFFRERFIIKKRREVEIIGGIFGQPFGVPFFFQRKKGTTKPYFVPSLSSEAKDVDCLACCFRGLSFVLEIKKSRRFLLLKQRATEQAIECPRWT